MPLGEDQTMAYFDDANTLVEHVENELPKLQHAYDESLDEKNIKPQLLVDIKNVMENLRSALDFAAHGLFDRYGNSKKTNPNIYFPYSRLGQDLAAFRASNRIETCIPGIAATRPDIVAALESYQHFSDPKNEWLPLFMVLNNENKHQRLTPQTRVDVQQLIASLGKASISFGEGGTESTATNYQSAIKWVSFTFSSNDQLVIQFLKTAVENTKRIVTELGSI